MTEHEMIPVFLANIVSFRNSLLKREGQREIPACAGITKRTYTNPQNNSDSNQRNKEAKEAYFAFLFLFPTLFSIIYYLLHGFRHCERGNPSLSKIRESGFPPARE
jgi:hypothetical protein